MWSSRRSRQLIGAATLLLTASGVGCTDDVFLDTGDVLTLTVDPSYLYAGDTPGTCDAHVHIHGLHADGSEAGGTKVQLWITGAGVATLSVDSVVLSNDGTSASACLHASDAAGSVTLHGRSGPIETTATVEIRSRTVPAMGSLVLTASPISAMTTPPPNMCAASTPSACVPGTERGSRIVLQGLPSEMLPVPEGASVTLTTTFGWLATESCDGAPNGVLNLALHGGTAYAYACFPDVGGSATLTARSGTLTTTAQLETRTVARSVQLIPSRTQTTAGTAVSFVAFVADCEGHGVADVPLVFHTVSGTFTPADSTPAVLKTGMDGSVTINGTAAAVPVALGIEILGAPQLQCAATIGAQP